MISVVVINPFTPSSLYAMYFFWNKNDLIFIINNLFGKGRKLRDKSQQTFLGF